MSASPHRSVMSLMLGPKHCSSQAELSRVAHVLNQREMALQSERRRSQAAGGDKANAFSYLAQLTEPTVRPLSSQATGMHLMPCASQRRLTVPLFGIPRMRVTKSTLRGALATLATSASRPPNPMTLASRAKGGATRLSCKRAAPAMAGEKFRILPTWRSTCLFMTNVLKCKIAMRFYA